MSIDHDLINAVYHALGHDTPNGDPDKLGQAAQLLRAAADGLDELCFTLNSQIDPVLQANSGAGLDQFAQAWASLGARPTGQFATYAENLRLMANGCDQLADSINTFYHDADEKIADAGIGVGFGILGGFLTAGAADAILGPAIADLIGGGMLGALAEFGAAVGEIVATAADWAAVGIVSNVATSTTISDLEAVQFDGEGAQESQLQIQIYDGAIGGVLSGGLVKGISAASKETLAQIARIVEATETPEQQLGGAALRAAAGLVVENGASQAAISYISNTLTTDIINHKIDLTSVVEDTLKERISDALRGDEGEDHSTKGP